MIVDPDTYSNIREGVRALCEQFSPEYHRKVDDISKISELYGPQPLVSMQSETPSLQVTA